MTPGKVRVSPHKPWRHHPVPPRHDQSALAWSRSILPGVAPPSAALTSAALPSAALPSAALPSALGPLDGVDVGERGGRCVSRDE
eukprot:6843492-Prymnesium_polylepis.1